MFSSSQTINTIILSFITGILKKAGEYFFEKILLFKFSSFSMLDFIATFSFAFTIITIFKAIYSKIKENKTTEITNLDKNLESSFDDGFNETWFEIECNESNINHTKDSNIHTMKNIGTYMIFYNDKAKKNPEIQTNLFMTFKKEIFIDEFKIDIIQISGEVKNPYSWGGFSPVKRVFKDKQLIQCLFLTIGNIDIKNGKYRICFIRK